MKDIAAIAVLALATFSIGCTTTHINLQPFAGDKYELFAQNRIVCTTHCDPPVCIYISGTKSCSAPSCTTVCR
jgi:hypothetical protein